MDFLTNPFIAILFFLYQILGGSLFLAIVVFTIVTRVATYPLTQQSVNSSKKMREINPKLQQLREKYKGDREKMAQAQMALYREHGINPLAGCLPLLIQMPILFGLYGAIYGALGNTPLQLLDLQKRLMGTPELSKLIPLQTDFLWMNLGQPDPTLILPILVVATTWLQTKLTVPPVSDPKDPSAAMSRNMTVIMPLMIGLFSLSFASGLSIYWAISNVVGIAQYVAMGQADFRNLFRKAPAPARSAAPTRAVETAPDETPKSKPKKRRLAESRAEAEGSSLEAAPEPARSGGTPGRKRRSGSTKAATARKPKASKVK